jgi:predicted permease
VTERLEAIPGVRGVAVSNLPLLSNNTNSTSFFREGTKYDSINVLQISPDYFKTMEMPLVSGRSFTERDNETAPKVAVINETAARKYFPNGTPLGLRLGTTAEQSNEIEIVGVLRDAKYDSVRGEIPATMYMPYRQGRPATMFHVRVAADPATAIGAIRAAVRRIDPDLPLLDLATQADQIDKNLLQERVFAQAYAMFGALALVIASVGLFGLMSYSVARRTNEIGIRMALGARGQDVLSLVMGESMILVVIGIGIGLVTALAAGRLITALLFGLAATDAPTILGAVTLMVLVSAIAGYLPARRAARVDPLVALHYE